ncbi:MAG: 5'-nucleotidase C-terminal domain-containing protein [Chloroflexota bacterium]|nr:5'-nucleotidase C-terminal domain-containing protein [Chloroflexota bacterium]
MTQLARTIRIVPGIALVLSAIALVACGGQTRQQAPIDTATPTVVEKIVEVEKVVEKIVEVAVPATPIVIEKIVEKEVEVPVEVIREVVVVVTATPASTPVPTATPMAMKTQAPVPLPATTAEPQDVQLRIIAINDLHGHIATSSDAFGGVGRVDYLAANISAARAEYEHSVFVSAGDLIGGSPLVSALFHDEPTIEAMNLMGLDINSVGNHEFDDGIEELVRMQQGGAHPTDGDLDGDPFAGADFQFLAANVIDDRTGNTVFPPYAIREFGGVSIAFVGLTLEGTANIVARSSVEGLTFANVAETVNSLIPELRSKGIEAVVVLLHEGGSSDGGKDDCGSGLDGAVAEITAQLDDAVDLVIAGHTNDEFVCEIDGKWITMADNAGRLFTVIDVTLDGTTKDLTVQDIRNLPNSQDGVTPDPELTALIEKYEALSAPRANAVIGRTTSDILRQPNEAGESALGNVIADAHLEATREAGAVVAFMNRGGMRNDILFASSGPESDGELTYAEVFSVHPFGNSMVTMTLTGRQIDTLLEQQFRDEDVTTRGVLQVSRGFSYEWDGTQPVGARVDISSIKISGVAVEPDATYRITTNSFLADGGSGFSVFTEGTDRTGGIIDVEALAAYFASTNEVAPGPQDRIMRLD